MTYEELVTFLAEIEATLNSRLLIQISDDINDFSVLTLDHFTLGKQSLHFSPDTIKDDNVTSRTHWKAVKAPIKMFWISFIREHLPKLPICKK